MCKSKYHHNNIKYSVTVKATIASAYFVAHERKKTQDRQHNSISIVRDKKFK